MQHITAPTRVSSFLPLLGYMGELVRECESVRV
jgi:hypothetical protein